MEWETGLIKAIINDLTIFALDWVELTLHRLVFLLNDASYPKY